MAEEKQGFEQLSQGDLNNVKAGIPPYESPVIVDLSVGLDKTCGTGTSCVSGYYGNCDLGVICRSGEQKE